MRCRWVSVANYKIGLNSGMVLDFATMPGMHDILVVLVHSIVTVVRLIKPGGLRAVVAESALTRHQLLILNRSRKRAPSLRVSDRMIAGLCTLLMHPSRMLRCGIVLKPSTLLHFHHLLTKRKYHMLFSSKRRGRPGPKGPDQELIEAVVEMKRRNPTWGCPRIAQQITLAFGVDIDKDVVRRILGKHYGLESGSGGPSWLTFLGQAKDSLWSVDLFRCESLSLRTHWVLVVMDQFTRRIIGFGIHRGPVDGPSLCAMFQRAIQGQALPKYLSTDNDPLYRFHQWQANLRVLDVMEIKTVPYVPLSHPFVERLVGTLRRECLDRTLFWISADLEAKLREFQKYFNEHRTHAGIEGRLPDSNGPSSPVSLASYGWQKHCRGLYQTPIAA